MSGMSDETGWGWMEVDKQVAFGPHPSREEALTEAGSEAEGDEVLIGRCVEPDPGYYVRCDAMEIAEQMDESAFDNEYHWHDGEVFSERKKGEYESMDAQQELEEFMRAWARKWFRPLVWNLEQTERVKLERDKP